MHSFFYTLYAEIPFAFSCATMHHIFYKLFRVKWEFCKREKTFGYYIEFLIYSMLSRYPAHLTYRSSIHLTLFKSCMVCRMENILGNKRIECMLLISPLMYFFANLKWHFQRSITVPLLSKRIFEHSIL